MRPIFIICISFLIISCGPDPAYLNEINSYRTEHLGDLIHNERAPLDSSNLEDVTFFDLDPSWKLHGEFQAATNSDSFDMATYSGKTKPYFTYGEVTLDRGDSRFTIEVYKSVRLSAMPEYATHLFLPFKDVTNGESSYGGGRYIDLDESDINNNVVLIDFNKCYNPWCAYSDGFNCPIPPKANHMDFEILAGESAYKGEIKGK